MLTPPPSPPQVVAEPASAAESLWAGQARVLERVLRDEPLSTTLVELVHVLEAHSPGMLCSVLLLDDQGILRLGAAPSLAAAYSQGINGEHIGPAEGSCGTAAFTGEAVIVEDIARSPLWAKYRVAALRNGLRACWSTPIKSKTNAVLGTFAMYYRRPHKPSSRDRRLVELATHLAGVAIERDRAQAERARMHAEREAVLLQIQAALQQRDVFLSMLAHELRTPVTALMLQLEGLSRSLGDDRIDLTRTRSKTDRAVRHLRRLALLIEDFLRDTRRIQEVPALGTIPATDLSGVVASVVAEHRDAFARSGTPLLYSHGPTVLGRWDPACVGLVLTKLLQNALKYGQGNPVEVSVRADEDMACISVRDRGIGISSAKQATIFQRFGRAARERSYGGLGLGLWASRQMVEAMGGRLRVASVEGDGATFTMELRRARPLTASPPP
ncbi:MAG TPA: HAMP domain-containing sensor histidine kinase [Myxococcota bacterium]|nr:HAMP domain-containing sensor histidine kinase [Myxococcota bacterium]